MVSRAAHYRNKARHAQQPFGFVGSSKPIDDSTWFTGGEEAVLAIAGEDNVILLEDAARAMDVDLVEAERRLRYMCRGGFLHMQAERDAAGRFVRFSWSLGRPGVPRT